MVSQCPYSSLCLPATDLPRIVVIGAGFAGINLIKKLRNKRVQLVLLDKNNFHQFQPLLYQVAIAGLEPDSIVTPIRKLFQGYHNLVYRLAEVERIDPDSRRVITDIGWVQYDYVVIATGSVTNYFGLEDVARNSVGLKDIRDALNIRSWVLQNLEAAAITCDQNEKEALTNFVIVGGGPAGVELAGALSEFRRYLLRKDYPEIAEEWMKVYLVEATDRLLGTMPKAASDHAFRTLSQLEVEIRLNTTVQGCTGSEVLLADNQTLLAKTLIWTAGVKGAAPAGLAPECSTKSRRIKVDLFNQVEGCRNVFAIGDIAAMIDERWPQGHPMVAQVAIQQGKLLAENLMHLIKNGTFNKAFRYRDKGSMATIGKRNAVAEIGGSIWKGKLAWLLWSTVHLFSITGFKNKLMVGINWGIRYLTYEKANRLIIREFKPQQNHTGAHEDIEKLCKGRQKQV